MNKGFWQLRSVLELTTTTLPTLIPNTFYMPFRICAHSSENVRKQLPK